MSKILLLLLFILTISHSFVVSDLEKEGIKKKCKNTKKLLKKPEQVIHCAKQVLYQEPELLPDSEVSTQEISGVTITKYEKVSSVVWPYYPKNYQRDEDDLEPQTWFHTVITFVPQGLELSETAFLYIEGGSNLPKPEGFPESFDGDLSNSDDEVFAQLALAISSVVVRLRHIPNQPMLIDGSYEVEDAIIAYTWRKFLENAEKYTYFPLHLPMSVASTEIMTWVQQNIEDVQINNFIVSGGSKRGWTTWISSLMDDRVIGIIPIVIDILNVERQFDDINRSYAGKWPIALFDYNKQSITNYRNFIGDANTNFALLNKINDPLAYKFEETKRLSIPKYIINAANDEFFLPNGSQVYLKALPNQRETFIRNVQNSGHGVDALRIIFGMASFFNQVSQYQLYPELITQEQIDNSTGLTLSLQFTCNIPGICEQDDSVQATLWIANNEIARDFRDTCMQDYQRVFPEFAETKTGIYQPTQLSLNRNQNIFTVEVNVEIPQNGWRAILVEFTDQSQFTITSQVYILEGENINPNANMPQYRVLDNGSVEPLVMCTVLETVRELV